MSLGILLRHYWRSTIVLCSILYLSFAPPSTFKEIPSVVENEDKLVHLLMYGGLSFSLLLDLLTHLKSKFKSWHLLLIGMLFPMLLGGMLEFFQPLYFAPRTGSWGDVAANSTGVMLNSILFFLLKKTKLSRRFEQN